MFELRFSCLRAGHLISTGVWSFVGSVGDGWLLVFPGGDVRERNSEAVTRPVAKGVKLLTWVCSAYRRQFCDVCARAVDVSVYFPSSPLGDRDTTPFLSGEQVFSGGPLPWILSPIQLFAQ